jgi:deazaflavin-dependent oxidoreductase (nitroreductase family)
MSDGEPRKSDLNTDLTLLGEEHVRQYRETDGATGYAWNGTTTLLLTTKGRKSGLDRTIAIIFAEVDGKYILIASKGGAPAHPQWYLNLCDEPRVTLQIKSDIFAATARTAEGKERDQLWAVANQQWPKFDLYQARTERKIPVVVLERSGG